MACENTGSEAGPPSGDTLKVVLHFDRAEGAPRVAVEIPRWIWDGIKLEAEFEDFEDEYDELSWLESEVKQYLLDDVGINVDDSPSASVSSAKDLRSLVKAKGYSIAGWASHNGWNVHTVRAALAGIRGKRGPLSQCIRKKALAL